MYSWFASDIQPTTFYLSGPQHIPAKCLNYRLKRGSSAKLISGIWIDASINTRCRYSRVSICRVSGKREIINKYIIQMFVCFTCWMSIYSICTVYGRGGQKFVKNKFGQCTCHSLVCINLFLVGLFAFLSFSCYLFMHSYIVSLCRLLLPQGGDSLSICPDI